MANQEHFEILKQGVGTWNTWRKEHPEIFPDLIGADLGRITLDGADLQKAKLSRIRFPKGRLLGADLRWADLTEAYLQEPFFVGGKLQGANFSEADLHQESSLSLLFISFSSSLKIHPMLKVFLNKPGFTFCAL